MQLTTFRIFNDTKAEMLIIQEPNGFEFILPADDEILIEFNSGENGVILKQSLEGGKIVISILDDLSSYKVLYKSKDIFERFK